MRAQDARVADLAVEGHEPYLPARADGGYPVHESPGSRVERAAAEDRHREVPPSRREPLRQKVLTLRPRGREDTKPHGRPDGERPEEEGAGVTRGERKVRRHARHD